MGKKKLQANPVPNPMIMPHSTPTSSCWCKNRTTRATGRLKVDLHVDRRIIKKRRGLSERRKIRQEKNKEKRKKARWSYESKATCV